MLGRFPQAKGAEKGLSLLTVHLQEGARVTVDGFGMPFNSVDAELNAWVKDNKPIVDDITLLDVLEQENFSFIVAIPAQDTEKHWDEGRLPPPFSYPYGTEHSWDLSRYEGLLREHKSQTQFQPAYA
jgi:hypothetical protein